MQNLVVIGVVVVVAVRKRKANHEQAHSVTRMLLQVETFSR